MSDQQRGVSELVNGMSKLPQVMINVEVPDPGQTAQSDALTTAINQQQLVLADQGRILVRPSGTEPLLRVMVEGESHEQVHKIATELASVAESNPS